MGAKPSKPRIRRSRRFSSLRKRQAPEGSNDPSPPPNEVWQHGNINKLSGHEDSCKFCGISEKCHNTLPQDHRTVKARDRGIEKPSLLSGENKLFMEDFIIPTGLRVELPPRDRRECCGTCEDREKSMSFADKSTVHDFNPAVREKDGEQEWTITLYEIDKMSCRVPREDMVRLMSSIYEAVDAKVGESPQGRKTVRVRLSVTPDRTSQSKVLRNAYNPHREQMECRCVNCPNTEPFSRKGVADTRSSRIGRSDTASPVRARNNIAASQSRRHPHVSTSRQTRDHSSENFERQKHYAKLEGLENTMYLHKKEKDVLPCSSKNAIDRTKSLPQSRNRSWTKFDEQHHHKPIPKSTSSARHRQRYHVSDSRNAVQRSRRKDPRFASPYDQHFQEAMYLRLRELQRQGTFEKRRAVGIEDSDEADEDSDCCSDKVDSDTDRAVHINTSEDNNSYKYSGTTNVNVEGNKKIESVTTVQATPKLENLDVTSIHHHHHYHHGLNESPLAALADSADKLSLECVKGSANDTCSSIIFKADDSGAIVERAGHQHHYHHHYHHAAGS